MKFGEKGVEGAKVQSHLNALFGSSNISRASDICVCCRSSLNVHNLAVHVILVRNCGGSGGSYLIFVLTNTICFTTNH